jgi:ribosomal-protein-alanine acetyltransferase
MIRDATPRDIPSMMNLARESSSAAQWTTKQYEDLFPDAQMESIRRFAVVAVQNDVSDASQNEVLGFLIARHLAPEWELENIVVAPAARRTGVGRKLVHALIAAAHETDSESVFLEVRESNSATRALYEQCGFTAQGRRKSYYSNPSEDAVIYRLTLR